MDLLMMVVVLTNLLCLGSSRLRTCVQMMALQGAAAGVLPLLATDSPRLLTVSFAIVLIGLKGLVFPALLERSLRQARVSREVEPFVGFTVSILVGVALLGVSIWLGDALPPPPAGPRVVPVALFTIMVGLFTIVSRRNALSQVIGYLIVENGIYVFGAALLEHSPLMVELGILLDVFAAVFVMGIAIFHISREFDHVDADRLSELRE